MPVIEGVEKLSATGVGVGETKWACGLYDFAKDGGAVGAVTLRGPKIPAGAILLDSFISVDIAPASGGAATISLGVEGAADINAAAAFNGAPYSTLTPKRLGYTATTAIVKASVARNIVATIAAAALTAGRFKVYVAYVEIDSTEV